MLGLLRAHKIDIEGEGVLYFVEAGSDAVSFLTTLKTTTKLLILLLLFQKLQHPIKFATTTTVQ